MIAESPVAEPATTAPSDALAALLDERGVVVGRGRASIGGPADAIEDAVRDAGRRLPGLPRTPADTPLATYLGLVPAGVDGDGLPTGDVDVLRGLFAVLPPVVGGRVTWWRWSSDGWVRLHHAPSLDGGNGLRWVSPATATAWQGAMSQGRAVRGRLLLDRELSGLEDALDAAFWNDGADVVDLPVGYAQWSATGDGLHVEVGDDGDYEQPLDPRFRRMAVGLGWNAPSGEYRNAWLRIDTSTDLPTIATMIRRTGLALSSGLGPRLHPSVLASRRAARRPAPGVVVAPVFAVDTTDDVQRAAAEVFDHHRFIDGPSVVIDLVDAFVELPATPLDEVIAPGASASAVARTLRGLADGGVVRLSVSVREQTSGLLEGLPQPFAGRRAQGRTLARALADPALAQVKVLVAALALSEEDPFLVALSRNRDLDWVRAPALHAFDGGTDATTGDAGGDRRRSCVVCGGSEFPGHLWPLRRITR